MKKTLLPLMLTAFVSLLLIACDSDKKAVASSEQSTTEVSEGKENADEWGEIFTVEGNTITGLTDHGKEEYTDLEIPSAINGVEINSIAENAFQNCTNLTSVTFHDNIRSIGENAFENCTGLTGLYIKDIAAFCTIVFGNGYSNPLYYADLYINDTLITDLTLPDSVVSIGKSAFFKCRSLESVTIPDSVTSIGSYAFDGCEGLTNVHMGNGVTTINAYTFYGCNSLKTVSFPQGLTSIKKGAFENCDSLTSLEFPNTLTEIETKAFKGCNGLTQLTIPESVETIGSSAFNACSGLEKITLPFTGVRRCDTPLTSWDKSLHFGYIFGAVEYDGSTAAEISSSTSYYLPTSLKSVTLTSGNIMDFAFYRCRSLTSIAIPEDATTIGENAFV